MKKLIRRLKKVKLKNGEVMQLVLMASWIFTVGFLVFYFNGLIERNQKDLTRIIGQSGGDLSPLVRDMVSPETLFKLKESGIERYFLSEVELNNYDYAQIVHRCLFTGSKQIFPSYVYETWSHANYPEVDGKRPQVALVRYLLLPEDNAKFQLDKACFIKEIKTEKDWQEMKERYGFTKEQF